MMSKTALISVTLVAILALSGCAVIDRDLRDAKACEGLSSVSDPTSPDFSAELRSLALPHASARLGRDLYDLSRLQNELTTGKIVPSPSALRQVEQLGTRITVRCAEVQHLISSPASQPAVDSEPPASQPATDTEPDPVAPEDDSGDGGGLTGDISALRIEPEDRSGYDRSLFEHWIDANGDGCDTRRTVLIEESITPVQVGPGCDITGGTWISVYDGFTSTNPRDFDVDHVVPLAEAWDSGARTWTNERRRDFANDLSFEQTLIAVSASSNRSKSDKDPAGWMPPNSDFHCEYVEIWVEIKIKWGLSVDEVEARVIEQVLSNC